MQYTASFAVLALMATGTLAHMEMSSPPPFRSKFNKLADQGKVDYSGTSPLSGPSQVPCKGFHTDMGTPGGASVITWNAGAKANFTIVGGAAHGGGSCQASLSYDGGKSFTVIHSYMGKCPLDQTSNFDFTIPSDAKNGAAIFGWTWFNKIGNREMYMNCASVTIAGGKKKRDAGAVAFSARPGIFVGADALNNGCKVADGKDLTFPNPGPDVTGTGDGPGSLIGTCAAVNGLGGPSSGSSSGGSGSAAPAASGAPAVSSGTASSTSVAIVPVSSSAPATSSAPANSGFATSVSPVGASSTASASAPLGTGTSGTSGSVSASTNGQCSGSQTCAGQTKFGSCCSKFGYCGDTPLHCGAGCMPAFGTCGGSANNSTSVKARGFLKGRRSVRVL